MKPQIIEAGNSGLAEVSGSWTVANASDLDLIVKKLEQQPLHATEIDAHNITAFDTYGAQVLARVKRRFGKGASALTVRALGDRYSNLFERVESARSELSPAKQQSSLLIAPVESLGRKIVESSSGLEGLLVMFGEVCSAAARVIFRPRSFRLTSAINQLDRVGLQAIPIIVLITFLIGCIIAQQGFFHFRKFGADEYVVDMVGILTLREFGVLIVAIMVAGRSGSAYTAELGAMKMREEIDALRTMGLDPVEVLVLPRILALVIALPLLTFIGSMAALYGGGLTAWLYGQMDPDIFVSRLREAISLTHFKVGLIKAPFMALAIGVVACADGFAVKGSAESLGRQTTSSVVKSIFLVIVFDGLFAVFFAAIGM